MGHWVAHSWSDNSDEHPDHSGNEKSLRITDSGIKFHGNGRA